LSLVEGRGEALGDDDLTSALSALARCAREGGAREEVVGHAAFQAFAHEEEVVVVCQGKPAGGRRWWGMLLLSSCR
jgi:hypothetical protein